MDLNAFHFSIPYKVGIKDLNYGGHVGYEQHLIYFQEVRIAYLESLGFSELNIGGSGIIAKNVSIEYKAELFHHDELTFYCRVKELKKSAFIMEYVVERQDKKIASIGEIVLVSFNYEEKKIARLPEVFVEKVKELEQI